MKSLSVLLAALLMIVLPGCGDSAPPEDPNPDAAETSDEPVDTSAEEGMDAASEGEGDYTTSDG
ncbi:MAG: hypothetical protein ACYTGL_07975 [Planctomycetota bacterium]|jgi:hypothetical protein